MNHLEPGTIVDEKYEIISTVGSGGFGTVYRARQVQLDRIIALKTLAGSYVDEEMLMRFEREALVISTMQHKNLVTFYGYGIWRNVAYIAMEYLDGDSLERILRVSGRLEIPQTLDIMRQVCEALKCAHSNGVVHRDLKPTNVMLLDRERGDNVKVIDFGLAKMMPFFGAAGQKLTAEGMAVGSVAFMSPEQCITGEVDHRSDLYSAGCIMHACLTGLPPFSSADTVTVMVSHVQATPMSLSECCPDVVFPPGLQEILFKTLAKLPEDRYQSAEEMLFDLHALASGKAVKLLPAKFRPAPAGISSGSAKGNLVVPVLGVALIALTLTGNQLGWFNRLQNKIGPEGKTSASVYREAQAEDLPFFPTNEAAFPHIQKYEHALLLARSDNLLNSDAQMEILCRLAHLYRVKGSPTNEQENAQHAIDLATRAGGGGEHRLDAEACILHAHNSKHEFYEAVTMTDLRILRRNFDPVWDDYRTALYLELADSCYGAGRFEDYLLCLAPLDVSRATAELQPRILIAKAQACILRKDYGEAIRLLDHALSWKDPQGRTLSSRQSIEDNALVVRLMREKARAMLLAGDLKKGRLVLDYLDKRKVSDVRRFFSFEALDFAYQGEWARAEMSLNVALDYVEKSPSSFYASGVFLELPKFIQLARAAGKEDLVSRIRVRHKRVRQLAAEAKLLLHRPDNPLSNQS